MSACEGPTYLWATVEVCMHVLDVFVDDVPAVMGALPSCTAP
jgi:hypothetical protein